MTKQEKQEQLNALYSQKVDLENLLKKDDYKIIKCAESQALGIELPYDIVSLHNERQTIRDQINSIEDQMADIEAQEEQEDIPEIVDVI